MTKRSEERKMLLAGLKAFHRRIESGEDKLEALKYFASIAIRRSDRTTYQERKHHLTLLKRGTRIRLGKGWCFSCPHYEPLVWHHVIQIQHGGTNDPRNLVAICEWCHSEIHPWLKAPKVEGPEAIHRPAWMQWTHND